MKLPTDETDGALSNELKAIFESVAERLGELRAESYDEKTPAYRELLAIYVALAHRRLDQFYGMRK